jgi:serine protease Do
VQIVAKGSLRDPEVGLATTAGSGSGFIIDPSGIIVTNNHVVTGAATLEVFVGGSDDGQNARVLGVSECNDLALIQLTGGSDYPYLEWYDGEIDAGLEIYAAGFPLGDPQFTLTKGIVAKAKAGGDLTGTSSIDHTIEHDANIQPGNSGGPLVNAEGKVVGVNYAGGDTRGTGTNQFFAIASDLAQPVVERLHDGDFESIGVNGWAVVDEEAGLAGVWVAGVATGSPASETGVQPGDIITTLQNLPVGRDGTFRDYCDVIRTAGDGAKMAVEVIRFDTSEVLKGELNGKELEQTFSFAQELEDDVDTEPTTDYYADYDAVVDDTGRLQVEVPSDWSSRQTASEVLDDGTTLPAIAASTNIQSYFSSYDVPGMQFVLFDGQGGIDLNAALDSLSPGSDCTDGGRFDYSDAVFTGRYNVYTDCGTAGATYITLTAAPSAGGDYLAVLAVQALTDADLEALDRILGTFNVVG